MKKAITIASMTLLALSCLTGCDFFRKVAGRPVSEEILAKAQMIAQARVDSAAKEQVRLDSIAAVRRYTQDSIAAIDSLRHERVMDSRDLGGLKNSAQLKKYYIVIGSFSNKSNAERLSEEVSLKGFAAEQIPFRNGYTAVGLSGTDDVVEIRRSLNEVRRQDFCPKGVWVLVNEKYEE